MSVSSAVLWAGAPEGPGRDIVGDEWTRPWTIELYISKQVSAPCAHGSIIAMPNVERSERVLPAGSVAIQL